MSKVSIPDYDSDARAFGEAVKLNVDRMTGQTKNSTPLPVLASTAALADVIAAYELLRKRLEGA